MSREELEIILKARQEGQAAFAAMDQNLKGLAAEAKKTSEAASHLSERAGKLSDSIGRTATTMARAADLFGLPVGPLRAIDDAADIAELGLKNLSSSAAGFNTASLGVVGAGLAIGTMLGGLLTKLGQTEFGMNVLGLSTKKLDADMARLFGTMKGVSTGPAGYDPKQIAAGHIEAQKKQIEALKAGGVSLKELQQTYKDAPKDIQKFIEGLTQEKKASDEAAAAAKQHAEEIRNLAASYGPPIAAAQQINEAFADTAKILALPDEGLIKLGDDMAKLADAGLEVPKLTIVFGELAARGIDPAARAARELSKEIGPLKSAVGTFAGLANLIGGTGPGGLGAAAPTAPFLGGTFSAMEGIKEKTEETKDATFEWEQQLEDIANLAQTLPGIFGQALGGILSGIAGIGSALKNIGGVGGLGKALSGGQGLGGILAGIGAAGQIAGAAVGIGKAIVGLFKSDPIKKAQKEAGAALGTGISRELAEQISKDAKALGLSIKDAALLSLSEAMDESGKSAVEFGDEMSTLLQGIASGSIPAKQGIDELGESFSKLVEEAEAGSVAAMASMGQLAAQARALGQDVPEITAAVKDAVASSMGATGALGGIKIISEADARAQAQIFLNVFNSTLATEGVVAAAEAIQPAIKTFQEQLSKAGISKGTADTILGPIHSAMSLLKNDLTKGGAEGAQALKTILEGQLKSGFLDTGTFAAIQQQAKTAFDQMIKGGADTKAAFQAAAPLLAQLQQTAQATGQALDPVTQQMIEQAKAAGVAFPVDTGTQMVDLLKELVTVMGGQLPASVQAAASSMTAIGTSTSTAAAAATSSLTEIQSVAAATSDSMGQQFAAAFDVAQSGAQQFVAQLGQIAGTQIPINFKYGGFEGGFGGGPFGGGIPAFQHGGFVREGGRRGRVVRTAERGTGGEWQIPHKVFAPLIAAIAKAAQSGGGPAQFVVNGHVFAELQNDNVRRNRRGALTQIRRGRR